MARNRQSKAAAAVERLQQANYTLHRWRPRVGRVADLRRLVAERRRFEPAELVPIPPLPAEPARDEPPPRAEEPERPLQPSDGARFRQIRRRTTLWTRASFRARTLARAVRLAIAEVAWRLSLLRSWYRGHRGEVRCALAALLLLAL